MSDKCQLLDDFLVYIETIKGKSEKTSKEYFYDLRIFLKYIKIKKLGLDISTIDDVSIDDIDSSLLNSVRLTDLYSYMNFLSKKKVNSSVTRARKVASIRSFFNYLHNKAGVIDNNPASELESPKISKRLPRHFSLEESKKLLNTVKGKHRERDYLILILFLNCGLRLSELVNIDLNNIKKNTLTVVGKGDKERTIYLNKACINSLNVYMRVRPSNGLNNDDKKALFISERKRRISGATVQYTVKKYIKEAGFDTTKFSTHKLRHTAATLMYKHGNVDIRTLQGILGHESVSTTEIYTHLDDQKLREAIDSNPLSDFKQSEGSNENDKEKEE